MKIKVDLDRIQLTYAVINSSFPEKYAILNLKCIQFMMLLKKCFFHNQMINMFDTLFNGDSNVPNSSDSDDKYLYLYSKINGLYLNATF